VKALKAYLLNHPDVDVISPEVASCFTGDEAEVTIIVTEPVQRRPSASAC